jgi:hypothetical protein
LWKAIADAGYVAPDNIGIQQGVIVVSVEVWHRCFIELFEARRMTTSQAQQKFQSARRSLLRLGVIGIQNDIAWLNDILMLSSGTIGK